MAMDAIPPISLGTQPFKSISLGTQLYVPNPHETSLIAILYLSHSLAYLICVTASECVSWISSFLSPTLTTYQIPLSYALEISSVFYRYSLRFIINWMSSLMSQLYQHIWSLSFRLHRIKSNPSKVCNIHLTILVSTHPRGMLCLHGICIHLAR